MQTQYRNFKSILEEFSYGPISVYPIFIKMTDSFSGAILLAQTIYWGKTMRGEFYKTDAEWQKDLFMSQQELNTAKKKIAKYIIIKKKGLPAKNHYSINWEALEEGFKKASQSMAQQSDSTGTPSFQDKNSKNMALNSVTPETGVTSDPRNYPDCLYTKNTTKNDVSVSSETSPSFFPSGKERVESAVPSLEEWMEETGVTATEAYRGEDEGMGPAYLVTGKKTPISYEELVKRYKKAISDKPKESLTEIFEIYSKFRALCKKQLGTEPIYDAKGRQIIRFALSTAKLTKTQIFDLFDEWFSLGRSDEETISITRALSANQINSYKIRNNVK